jgi:sulfite exporter TauE/SafE/copper chaperone CopZ
MPGKLAVHRVLVEGMSCSTCEQRIARAVEALAGVNHVSASAPLGEITVYHDPQAVAGPAIREAIRGSGYAVREEPEEDFPRLATDAHTRGSPGLTRFLGLVAIGVAAFLILKYMGGPSFLPAVSRSTSYGLVFVVGLLTSLHCVAMCGGIVLSQGIGREAKAEEPAAPAHSASFAARLFPSLLYNGGRIVSYTVIGGLVGGLGSVLNLSDALRGAMPIVAGAFMLFLGVRMLGIFPWLSRIPFRLPGIGGNRVRASTGRRGPLVVGLLNGLLPCGPLQTMQVYALATGSAFAGALSMFLFGLGTVPLLLGLGAISGLLSARFCGRMLRTSGALVVVLGLVMFARGMSLFGVALPRVDARPGTTAAVARTVGSVQEVSTTVEASAYHPIVVEKGVAVRWTITVKAQDLNSCNNPLIIPAYRIGVRLAPGANVVQFTPDQAGTYVYTCGMGMITSTIQVVDDLSNGTYS